MSSSKWSLRRECSASKAKLLQQVSLLFSCGCAFYRPINRPGDVSDGWTTARCAPSWMPRHRRTESYGPDGSERPLLQARGVRLGHHHGVGRRKRASLAATVRTARRGRARLPVNSSHLEFHDSVVKKSAPLSWCVVNKSDLR